MYKDEKLFILNIPIYPHQRIIIRFFFYSNKTLVRTSPYIYLSGVLKIYRYSSLRKKQPSLPGWVCFFCNKVKSVSYICYTLTVWVFLILVIIYRPRRQSGFVFFVYLPSQSISKWTKIQQNGSRCPTSSRTHPTLV